MYVYTHHFERTRSVIFSSVDIQIRKIKISVQASSRALAPTRHEPLVLHVVYFDRGKIWVLPCRNSTAPTGGPGLSASRGGEGERGRGLLRDGPALAREQAECGVCVGPRGSGPRGEAGLAREGNKLGRGEREKRAGPGLSWWASGMGFGLGCFGFGFGFSFSFYFFSFLNLIQTKFEFKYKFEFKPHSIKSMHQHECNTKIKPMINFKSLRNKIELNTLLITINLRNVNKAN